MSREKLDENLTTTPVIAVGLIEYKYEVNAELLWSCSGIDWEKGIVGNMIELEHCIEIIIRLFVASLLGGIIGLERSGAKHDAGLRTHVLVSLGAAGITAISHLLILEGYSTDISRFGAQVVSGIGFLGAGCIMVNNNKVKGLTTAAGLWTTACIGLATGLGYYIISGTITALVLIAMFALRPLANKLQHREYKDARLRITVKNRQSLQIVTSCIAEHECEVLSIVADEEDCFIIKLSKTTGDNISMILGNLMEHKEIKNVEII